MENIEISFPGGIKADAKYNGFTIHTDQPVDEGGDGTAPEPFTLFLAGLATCSGVYVLNFCKAREISTEGLRLVQKPTFNEKTKRLEKIEMEIYLPPEFPDKYEKAVIRVANLCAVKKAIIDPPEMTITALRG
ncbi:OsmC family protein [Dethiosulfatarculus sandiegensis]|uniref:Osmotically inducible protein C n=1 Tax=Dethiosulfatarculus sandiegensis TaxID=1429043 RepID=A0A0D2JC73_9BACT|nr:OsmC family protein [Dethiosulfatarculus sandiegensis]KIX13366.1 osmotically inducible protein C [Dethiosulfatarculus sandiegensis]